MDPAIRDWVAKARTGDPASFDLLVTEYASPLVRFLTGVLGGDVHAAHDVAQDAFLVAWRTLPRLEEPRYFRAWLFRVAYHRAVTWLRRRGPQGAPFRELAAESEGDRPPPTRIWGAERPHDPAYDKAPRLHAALSALPMRYASVITLFYFQGLGTRETAAALGVSHSTVKMRLHRGRSILRNKLDPVADPPPPDAAAPSAGSPTLSGDSSMKSCMPIVALFVLPVLAASVARAGPAEARARWREASAMSKNAPWHDRLVAYRAVRIEAPAQDPIQVRAVAAEAKILRDAGHAHGAAAAEAVAACFGGRRDPDRLAAALSAARELISDNDPAGARPLLDDVLENGGIATPQLTGPTLLILARQASDAQDLAALTRLDRRASNDVPAALTVRLQILDLLGLLRLDGGDMAAARRTLAEERRICDEATRAGGAPEREAAKAWLDLTLPKRL